MQIGTIIESGLRNWQIIQQVDGKGTINLQGRWSHNENLKNPKVLVRIVREDTSDIIIPWMPGALYDKNKWKISIREIPAGGLYRIETCLSPEDNTALEWSIRGDMIHHIGVGDIFVIAGQSNSAGYGKDPIFDAPQLGVHLLRNSGEWDLATHPMNESTGTIHEENTETANPGHSPYLNFAKYLKRVLGYPIGLVQAALGGSALSAWNPDEDGFLYRSMLRTINSLDSGIKGLLWYQGCSDAAENLCDTYLDRFKRLVSVLRADVKNDTLPVFTLQLSRFVAPSIRQSDIFWSILRESQRQAALEIPNLYVIPTLDCTLSDLIHVSSSSNMVLGERLAKTALTKIYGKNYICDAPDIMKAERLSSNEVELQFENVMDRIYILDSGADNISFTLEDEEGAIDIQKYEIKENSKIILTLSRDISGKCYVSGGYGQNPKGIVPFDYSAHIPMLAFYKKEVKTSDCKN